MTEIAEQIIKFGGLTPIIEMVSSGYDIMQNEALIALAFMSSTLQGETLFRRYKRYIAEIKRGLILL